MDGCRVLFAVEHVLCLASKRCQKKQAVNSECPIQGVILLLYFVLYQKYTG